MLQVISLQSSKRTTFTGEYFSVVFEQLRRHSAFKCIISHNIFWVIEDLYKTKLGMYS